MPELFEFPPTRSNRAKWALEELGADYTSHIVSFPEGKQQATSYKAIHPLGHVPAYRSDAYTMHESVAIVLQLIDEHPDSRLAPQSAQPTVPRIISGASLHVRSSTRIYST
jgi:glutathione S-transferase